MFYWKLSIKKLSGRKRNIAKARNLVLNGRNLNNAFELTETIEGLNKGMQEAIRLVRSRRIGKSVIRRLRKAHKVCFMLWLNELTTEVDVQNMKIEPEHHGPSITIDSLGDMMEDRLSKNFRFHSVAHLRRLYDGLKFPENFKGSRREKFTGEEVFLYGIYRLSHTETLTSEGVRSLFGFTSDSRASTCFKIFLTFMVENWGYLLTNNMEYWLPMMQGCADSIRAKCATNGCDFADNFCVFAFTDNTMNATCRPGGGPARDRTNAPRNDPDIQRAWYNGWKKLHGMKWQTVDMPNGMNFAVWGAVSCRHNDLFTLLHSDLNNKVRTIQIGKAMQFKIYGDSAYVHLSESHILARHNYEANTPQEVLENRVMSSCREQIEWDYGDIGRYFHLVDYKYVLQMRKMPVASMYLTAMILRNALNCLSPGITSQYFHCNPPTLEHWLAQGPKAKPNIEADFPLPA
jgi:hypothetical protein